MNEKRKEELLAILITTDGKGKDAKMDALVELLALGDRRITLSEVGCWEDEEAGRGQPR